MKSTPVCNCFAVDIHLIITGIGISIYRAHAIATPVLVSKISG
jgi:hypothetical protein